MKTSALALGGLSLPSLTSCGGNKEAAAAAAPQAKQFVGLQTYSLGQELEADVPGGLAKLKSWGYTDLELAGYNNGLQNGVAPAEYKKMVDDSGLKITSAHVGTPSQWQIPEDKFVEDWKKVVEDHKTLGVKYLIDPSQPQCATVDEVKKACDRFNKAGEICKEAGIMFGYHNHNGEFKKLATPEQIAQARKDIAAMIKDRWKAEPTEEMINGLLNNESFGMAPGTMYEQLFMDNTDPALVCFELDVYWCVIGDQDPVEWIQEHKDRFKLLHIKDRFVIGDSGMMNFPKIFETAYNCGINEFFVELEGNGKGMTQFEGVEASAKYLCSSPFVK